MSCGFALVLACMFVCYLRSAARKQLGESMARSVEYATERVSHGSKQNKTSILVTAAEAEVART